jgi:hypothetical protein
VWCRLVWWHGEAAFKVVGESLHLVPRTTF